MYIVLVNKQKLSPLKDLMPQMMKNFPDDRFSIHGSEEKGYQFQLDGAGDEMRPRKFAESFLKTWKPSLA
jgi:hypothetical protein